MSEEDLSAARLALSGRPTERPGYEDIADFLDHYGQKLLTKLAVLGRIEEPVPRLITFARTDDARKPWVEFSPTFAAPAVFQSPERLREAMRLVHEGSEDFGLIGWMGPGGARRDSMSVLLRHPNGEEFLLVASGGKLGISTLLPEAVDYMLAAQFREAQHFDGVLREASASLAKARPELAAKLEQAGAPALTAAHWELISVWASRPATWQLALVNGVLLHSEDFMDESNFLLEMVTTVLEERLNTVIKTFEGQLKQVKKDHEKRLKRLQSDLKTMRTLTDGVRRRAERTQAENAKLAAELRTLKGATAQALTASEANESDHAAQSAASLGQGLDALFVREANATGAQRVN